jgi:hypothetical protein
MAHDVEVDDPSLQRCATVGDAGAQLAGHAEAGSEVKPTTVEAMWMSEEVGLRIPLVTGDTGTTGRSGRAQTAT